MGVSLSMGGNCRELKALRRKNTHIQQLQQQCQVKDRILARIIAQQAAQYAKDKQLAQTIILSVEQPDEKKQQNIDELAEELEQYRRVCHQMEDEIANLRVRLLMRGEQREEENRKVKNLQKEFVEFKGQYDQVVEEYGLATKEIRQITRENSALEEQIDNCVRDLELHHLEMEELRSELQFERKENQTRIRELEQRLLDATNDRDREVASGVQFQKESEETHERVSRLEKEYDELFLQMTEQICQLTERLAQQDARR